MTAHQTHLSHPKYRPDIDGLRAVAVLSVVTFHAFPTWIKGGFIGVDVFFVISGFLISTIIFENLESGTFSFSEFYSRRIRRIFPALTVVLVACLAFGWFILLSDELNQLGKHTVAGAGFVSNLVLWSEVDYFDNSAETKPLLHLWSLGIEEQFYIIWPLLLWLAWKRNFNFLVIAVVAAFISFVLNFKDVSQDPVATFYSPLTRFWELLFGSTLAWYSLHKKKTIQIENGILEKSFLRSLLQFLRLDSEQDISNFFSFIGILLLSCGFWIINKDFNFPGYWALMPVFGSVLIILAGSKAWFNRVFLSNKIIVWFGLISFPLYLWHWPILSFGRIIYFDIPPPKFQVLAVGTSIFLAWLTVRFIEKPLRFGNRWSFLKVIGLSASMLIVASFGFIINKTDYSKTHTFDNRSVKRKGEHAIGSSLAWYQGKDNWLFLGNNYESTVAKLKLSVTPRADQIESTTHIFSKISQAALKENAHVVLIVGPNKSSIYPEYLPKELKPSPVRYSNFFIEELKKVPNLTVYDPTSDLLKLKNTEGILYYKTDTHWNNKGAFLTFSGFSKLLDLPIPQIQFRQGQPNSGDLIEISKLKDFPLSPLDNWDVVWKDNPVWKEEEIPNEKKTAFGTATVVTNNKPLSNKYVWVVGDSFTRALKPYFDATFKEVRYVGHWNRKLNEFLEDLSKAEKKPDLIVIVRVERSF